MRVKPSTLVDIPFPIAPLAEQQRIVEAIESLFTQLDAGVSALKRIQKTLQRYRASVLKAACEGNLVPQDPNDQPASELLEQILAERYARWESSEHAKGKLPVPSNYKAPTAPNTSELPDLPTGWVWAGLSQLGFIGRGKSKHRPRDDERLYNGKYPFIQTGEIKQANGVIIKYQKTYNEFGLSQSKLWEKGTLCITIAANIADTAILGFDACFPDSVVGFIGILGQTNTEFIELFFRTIKDRLEQFAPATAQKNINLETLENLAVPLPPLAEQKRIVAEVERRLSVIQAIEQMIEQNLARAERLRQSILKQAFSGQLVAQNPDDEPASVLLERIRAERTTPTKRTKNAEQARMDVGE